MSKKSILIIFFSALLVMAAQILKADVITVTTTQDNVPGSLRAAITTANTNGKDNTINLLAGTYLLSGAANDDANVSGDLDIKTRYKLTIEGVGASQTIIDGNGVDRVLHILKGTIVITDLTIRNGKAPNGLRPEWHIVNDGGGIYNIGNLTMTRCTIKKNTAGKGGSNDGDFITTENGGYGGGILNGGELVLNNCIVTGNLAGEGGDSYENDPPGVGGGGGGIWNSGILTLNNSAITVNRSGKGGYTNYPFWGEMSYGGNGGGIFNEYILNINNCNISNNKTGGPGPCKDSFCGHSGDGGGIYNIYNLNMQGCTVSANTTGSDFCETYGGGIYSGGDYNPNLTLIACTVSGNRAGIGGGVYNAEKSQLTSVTVANNGSGGIRNDGGSIRLKNSIIAYNTLSNGDPGPDCIGTFNWVCYSLIKDTTNCILTGTQQFNILGQDPLLGPLADNGGSTKTHALLPGSPVIDAGNSSDLSSDQRGYTRPIDIPGIVNVSDGADIGAYEFNASYAISGTITYGGDGMPGVTLTFSNNGGSTITDYDGYYSHTVVYNWTGTVTPTLEGYTFHPSGRNYTNVTANLSSQAYTATSIIPPQISLNRTQLTFGMNTDGVKTGPQSFLVSNSGGGMLKWTTGNNYAWLNCSPNSGTGSAAITVSVDPPELAPGTYTETITISAFNAGNSPQTVNVTLNVYDAGSTNLPIGSFDTPIGGSTVSGSIPVTGWALDNISVANVKIYRNPAAGEGDGLVYIGDAIFVEGARPDIVSLYPDYPNNYKAGWGYMLLTNALPEQGNGDFTLYAKAADKEGNIVTLGSKTINCDNANAVKPFGTIDTPIQGGIVSGNDYANYGWVLTPLPNTIPTNGSTITVWVDGVSLGHPVYNESRPDVAALFPNYNNSDRAGGHFHLDAAKFTNGVHTIAWTVVDNAGNADGIGSRYFAIQNSGNDLPGRGAAAFSPWSPGFSSPLAVPDYCETVRVKKGYNTDIEANEIYPADDGRIHIEIRELERVEIQLSPGTVNVSPLPVGSTFDTDRGIFYWQPGPGFIGQYHLVFVKKTETGQMNREEVVVTIVPKFPTSPAPNRAPGHPTFQE